MTITISQTIGRYLPGSLRNWDVTREGYRSNRPLEAGIEVRPFAGIHPDQYRRAVAAGLVEQRAGSPIKDYEPATRWHNHYALTAAGVAAIEAALKA